jgi:recombination protein RecA
MDNTETNDIKLVVADLKKHFGDGSICILGENEKLTSIETRSSGSLALDLALGGGWGKGRVVALTGPERSGKTSILCLTIAEAQYREPDKICAVVDLENTFNPNWATKLGVDLNKLIFIQPDKPAEEVYDMMETMISTNKFSVIGLDSLAGLVPKEEFDSDDWEKESRVGGASKINSKAVRKLVNTGLLTKSGTTLILINQLRDLIGGFSRYGTPTTTTGGRSLKHCYTHQVEISTGEYFSEGSASNKTIIGQQIVAKVTKNKIGPPFRKAVLDLYYSEGLDHVTELIAVARMVGVLSGAGAWFTAIDPRTQEKLIYMDKEIKFNGKDKAREAINEDIVNNGGGLYAILIDKVNEVIRTGGGVCSDF